ncbi:aspartate/glutamate racemase family protein [Agrobacterium tumefaciens]|uniref:aspartate/glutamate racemase family protein n=1 Tax=Rhizobium/Agrobacterium group TaxID=227290 RepID=UPI000D8AB9A1|nr:MULTISPECIES: aspartate/glutamate racemase family protein [Rhizobium/Agrobacterium group]MBO0128783.1 aspartate/glutamate racemase family protein [Agrobacterium sp. OT33]NTE56323.1 aspartate/glutamate racemase family protein [Agrobacterium tumefaciens]NTE69092.1 aspartate/glutamate racemase family protein [Agrobacterium tumefaciens]PYG55893.1 allantoin racemase [Rhizobium sp. UGM030330-04]
MRILIINPNTTQSMTATIADAATRVANADTQILAVTSSMGPVSIEGYYDEVFAVPGLLLELAKAPALGADAAVIACFDDTGLDAARALADIPVIGLCEAGVSSAAFIAQKFTIVTTMERSRLPLEHLVHRYGMSARCNVRAADIPVLSLEDPASNAGERLREEISMALRQDRAEAIVLGCAGMADLAAELGDEFGVPVIDGVAAAVKQAESLVRMGLSTAKRGAYAAPLSKPYRGLLEAFQPDRLAGASASP